MPAAALLALLLAALDGGTEPDAAVPDASLRATTGNPVRLELDDGTAVEGRLVGFEAEWVTIALSSNDEVVSVPRGKIAKLRALELPVPPERERIIGVHFGISVSLAVDAQYRMFYGFVNGNVLFPLTTLTTTAAWIAVAVGGGITVPLVKGSRWRVDVFGQMLPLYLSGPYTYLGVGVGFGLRYLGSSGFTFGIKVPLFGYAARTGHSPYGYDSSYRAAYGFGYYYLAGIMGLPLISVGYRF